MIETINAVYENGIFKPLNEVHISNGVKVKLTVETNDDNSIDDILELAGSVYEGLSNEDIADIEDIAYDREDFFDGGKKE